jgi:hypothetical protein
MNLTSLWKSGAGGRTTAGRSARLIAREFHGHPLILGSESLVLLLVSLLDLFMTYALLRQGMRFYESNPVARWFFARWNMAGMVGFKFLVIALAIVACEVVERRRPGVGRLILKLGIVAGSAVAIYSSLLFYRHVVPALD